VDIGVLGYIGIVWPKEHSPEVWSVPPVIPCIYEYYEYWHCTIISLWYYAVWKVGANALEQNTVSIIKAEGSVFPCNFSNHLADCITTQKTTTQLPPLWEPESHTYWYTLPLPPKTNKELLCGHVHRF